MIEIDGIPHAANGYLAYHGRRIAWTLEKLRRIGARRVLELGGHPWIMTAALIDEPGLELVATVSAEEVMRWPDDIGVRVQDHRLRTASGTEGSFRNYSVNIERRRFSVGEEIDTVLACEIVEHLTRAPHVMFLNVNDWLPRGGRLIVTTPNGAQFANPWRRSSRSPTYRANAYERHVFLYSLDQLVDLVTLCGFRVVESGYVNLYPRAGATKVYGWLARAPFGYCREKFSKTLHVVAVKDRDVEDLKRPPLVCDPRGEWEFVRPSSR